MATLVPAAGLAVLARVIAACLATGDAMPVVLYRMTLISRIDPVRWVVISIGEIACRTVDQALRDGG